LRRHDYPRAAAMLLGETLALAALLGSLLKTEGRLIVQAQGDGPISLLVAEYHDHGALRGYARLDENAAQTLSHAHRLPPRELLGEGALAITLEQEDRVPHQGFVDLEGETLAACAENYFQTSEQTETRIRLAVGEVVDATGQATWRASGILLQRIAADDARGDPEEDWSRAGYLFATLTDEELIDPALASDRLLYRLFHEEGVRMGEPAPLRDQCTCDEGRLAAVMKKFTTEEVSDLIEPDGKLHATCQFCARKYKIDPAALSA
jgi:molecular chaperone Hsp33